MTFNPQSIGFWITRRAELTPDRTACDFEDETFSYDRLNLMSNRAAAVLIDKGVRAGDRVAVLSENSPDHIAVFFACAKIGAVLVPVSWRLSEPEMTWQIGDSEPKLLVASSSWESVARRISDVPVTTFAELGAGSEEEPDDRSMSDDPLMILYTSGTTGRPKGAVLTHGNFFWANLNMIINSDIASDDVSLMFLPMFHIGGWNVNTLSVLWKGGTVVLEQAFDAERVLSLIQKKQVTWLMGVPATYLFMSQLPSFEQADFSSVRRMVVGGAPMPESLLQTYAAKGIDVVQGYGLTELAPNALLLPMEDAPRKLGSAGKPYFFTDTRLMDDTGAFLPPGSEGEIVAAGPVVMAGYHGRDDATAETIVDGWLHTGDIGRTDDEGYFWIVDRKKDMVISGGENVYPAEVENAIYEHTSVAEVAVIGVPDERWGERVHAIVVPKAGSDLAEDQVIAHCRTLLAGFKIPRSVEIRTEALPRTPAGKVQKPELRKPFWQDREKKI